MRLQAAAFDGWAAAVQSLRHKRKVAQQAGRRIANIRLSQVFARWQEQAEALQHARAQAGHIAAHMRNQALAAAFNSWAEAAQHQQTQSSRREQLADAAVSRARTALVVECFEVGVFMTQGQTQLRMLWPAKTGHSCVLEGSA